MTKFQKKLWGGIAVIALLTPLGLIIPAIFQGGLGGGDAWGEWEPDTLKKMGSTGFPVGTNRASRRKTGWQSCSSQSS